jgi:hypothetical protein
MSPETASSPRPNREPPLIEHARRGGWVLLGVALLCMVLFRLGPQSLHPWPAILGGAAGILGMLAILNVALVRSLYRQLDAAPPPEPEAEDAAMDDAARDTPVDAA